MNALIISQQLNLLVLNSGRNLRRNSNPTFLTMELDDDGDPPEGQTEETEDNGDVGMDIEETTEEFLKKLEKSSGSTSLQKEVARSSCTSGTTTATATAGITMRRRRQ
jgi:hypothetical protein